MTKKMLLGLILLITAMVTVVKVYLLNATAKRAQLAQQMTEPEYPAEIIALKNKILDEKETTSSRMMAVNALAQTQNELALNVLQDFIAEEIKSGDIEVENIIRTKAVEDIAYHIHRDKAIVALEKLEARQKHTFLADQMRRVVVALRFKQPIVQHTEDELRQIYQSRTQPRASY